MADREEQHGSDVPERHSDLDARVTSHLRDVAPADDITRQRHMRAARAAFDAHHAVAPEAAPGARQPSARGLRSQRIVGSIAAAALVMIGLGVVASLGGSDPPADVMRAATNPDSVIDAAQAAPSLQGSTALEEADQEPSNPATLAAPVETFLLAEVSGACVEVVEKELDRLARAAGVSRDPSLMVMVTPPDDDDASVHDTGQNTEQNSVRILTAEGLEVTINLGTCALHAPSGDAGSGSSR